MITPGRPPVAPCAGMLYHCVRFGDARDPFIRSTHSVVPSGKCEPEMQMSGARDVGERRLQGRQLRKTEAAGGDGCRGWTHTQHPQCG